MTLFFEMTYGIGQWLAGNFGYGTVGTILGVLIGFGVLLFGGCIDEIKTEGFGSIQYRFYVVLISSAITTIFLGTFWIVTLHPIYKAEDIVAKEVAKEIEASRHLAEFDQRRASEIAKFNRMQGAEKAFVWRKYLNIEKSYRDNKRLAANQLTRQQIAKKALRSTVLISGKIETDKNVIGSGFFIAPDLIATNFHVIKDVKKLTAELVDPKLVNRKVVYDVIGYRAIDPKNDLAILQVNILPVADIDSYVHGPRLPPPPLTVSWPGIGESSKASLHIGDPVYTAGNPSGKVGTFLAGWISNTLRRTICGVTPVGKHIQVQIPIYGGNSGGPLLDDRGLVIGVIYGGLVIPQKYGPDIPLANLSFAVAGYHLKELISEAKRKPVSQLPAEGTLCSANAHTALGHQLAKAGKYDLAIEKYTKAIAVASGGFSIGYLHRGLAKKKLGRASKVDLLVSEKLMERELRLRPPTSTISKAGKAVESSKAGKAVESSKVGKAVESSKVGKAVESGRKQLRRFFKFLRKIPL